MYPSRPPDEGKVETFLDRLRYTEIWCWQGDERDVSLSRVRYLDEMTEEEFAEVNAWLNPDHG